MLCVNVVRQQFRGSLKVFFFLGLGLLSLLAIPSAFAQTDVHVSGNVTTSVDANTSSFTAKPLTAVADGVTSITLTVTVKSQEGQKLPQRTVVITSSRGATFDLIRCYDGAVLTTKNQTTTNDQGEAVCLLTSTQPGQATLTATAEGVELNDHPTVTFTEVATAPTSPVTPGGTEPPSTPTSPTNPPQKNG